MARTYRRYAPAAPPQEPSVRDVRRQGGNSDRAASEGAVKVQPASPPPTKQPEPTAPAISPEASPAKTSGRKKSDQ